MCRRISCIALLILLPTAVAAKETTVWNFENGVIPGRWDVTGLTSTVPSLDGLRIVTEKDGRLVRNTEITHPVEVVTLTFGPSVPSEVILLWHIRGTPESELVQLPFAIEDPGGGVIPLNVSYYPQWDPWTDRIGVSLPTGAETTLRSITLEHWSISEQIAQAWKSFWTFDRVRPYTINFVWGPLLNFNPVARGEMYYQQPAAGWSANRLFYGFMLLTAAALAGLWYARWREVQTSPAAREAQHRYALIFLGMFASLWVLYDARMGLEFLGSFLYDYRTYLSAEPGERIFRQRGGFDDFVEHTRPFLADRDRYIFLSAHRWPYFGLARYLTYPSLPTEPGEAARGVDTWVVYDRTDIRVNVKQQLEGEGGETFSAPGTVLFEFAPGTLVFRTAKHEAPPSPLP